MPDKMVLKKNKFRFIDNVFCWQEFFNAIVAKIFILQESCKNLRNWNLEQAAFLVKIPEKMLRSAIVDLLWKVHKIGKIIGVTRNNRKTAGKAYERVLK